ncbi:MAG: CpaD family pilus assembly protein [Sphingomonadaceae bacterium]
MPIAIHRSFAGAIALTIGLSLSACGGMPENRSLYSTKQPVVERTNYTLDIAKGAGGLSIPEQRRLAEWFETMDLRYGDRVSLDDPGMSGSTREAVAGIAARHGILLSEGAPVTQGFVPSGMVRVVITRTDAEVPGCPDWSAKSQSNLTNGVYPNYGCAVNSNIAAMVANPEDLVNGQRGSGETIIMSSNKAIDTYREQEPTGKEGLKGGITQGGD